MNFVVSVIQKYTKISILVRILCGIILGVAAGLIFGENVKIIEPFGTAFMKLLMMVVVPIVFTTTVVGASSIEPMRIGRIGVKGMLFYLITTTVAVSLGVLGGNIFRPGKGLEVTGRAAGQVATHIQHVTFSEFILRIIPQNPIRALADGDILPILFFSFLIGIGLSIFKEKAADHKREHAQGVYNFCCGFAEILFLIVRWIIEYAPIGIFALMANLVASSGFSGIREMLLMLSVAVGCYFVQVLVVYCGLLRWHSLSPWIFFKGIREAMLTAFTTRSSLATLPVSMRNAEENLGVHKDIYSFTLPVGASVNMDGTAIFYGVALVFFGYAIGEPLTFAQQVTVILTGVLASVGTAGVPGVGGVMLLMMLSAVGFKITQGTTAASVFALIIGAEAILDMFMTTVNVTGDLAVTSIVAKSEGDIDLKRWKK
ncbi:dicarboxylate/amino acid:cation symporter [Lentisphaerota bacterium ZTH]|nr:dicarboxylate/amino acid:cation symporter [Lentisphaerota bacterium]WET06940.1 dicarboxylate/amino acid:cation symporter [Lentisphaerota bacterium ZTH]